MSSDSENELLAVFGNLCVSDQPPNEFEMDAQQLEQIVKSAVAGALSAQAAFVERRFTEFSNRLEQATRGNAPQVETFAPITINRDVRCDDGLEVVKSIVDFSGNRDKYVSWRQSATNAYEQFAQFEGSVKHYQAVNIIRNKVIGSADGTLTSFNTPLNFKAIIARLDTSYGDKTPLYLLEQKLSVLRQGQLTVREYYDEVEKGLTKITNKSIMSYDSAMATALNEKYRQDALRVFISGLKKSLSDVLFSSQPKDMPHALALAEELEGNRERYNFAANYSKYGEYREGEQKKIPIPNNYRSQNIPNSGNQEGGYKQNFNAPPAQSNRPEPMDIDRSMSRLRVHSGQDNNNAKRPLSTAERQSDRQRQRVNNLEAEEYEHYQQVAIDRLGEEEDEPEGDDVNFLGEAPCSRS